MRIHKNKNLKPLTTFKVGGKARHFAYVRNVGELEQALDFAKNNKQKVWVLGGGSNIVVSDRGYDGLVLHLQIKGVQISKFSANKHILKISAGEKWDDVVSLAVKKGLWGIENLSHIPGQAGAAVVQNIGAYGQEIAETLQEVEVYDIANKKIRKFKNADCKFSYRKSIFNSTERGKFIILSITLALKKNGKPKLEYKDLRVYFGNKKPKISEVRKAIIAIRNKKYPYPKKAKNGSAGSFFKNLYLSPTEYQKLQAKFVKSFGNEAVVKLSEKVRKNDRGVKIPTAFLIEKCGLKNYSNHGIVINKTQPLILLNKGHATAKDIIDMANKVVRSVYKKTGLKIKIEPELIGFSEKQVLKYK